MSIEEAILERVRAMPPDRQKEVLDFAGRLESRPEAKQPLESMKGLCADLAVSVSEEDIAEARQEMWENFPRDGI